MNDPQQPENGERPGSAEAEVEMEVVEIESDIEDTRADLGDTLDEIGQRLDPGRLADQAKDKVRDATIGRVEEAMDSAGETARGMSEMLMETIRKNPVPTVMAGIGLAMLWKNRSNGHSANWRSGSNGEAGYRQMSESGGLLDGAKDGAAQVGQRVGETASDAIGNVQQVAGSVAESAQQGAGEVTDRARRAYVQMPFAAGIAAIGAGAAVGTLLPETAVEEQVLAKPSSEVLAAAGDAATDVAEKTERLAKRATSSARQKASV